MKTLKFRHDFVKEILEGRKNTTWRLFDDKNLTLGDELELVDMESGDRFAKALITDLYEKKIKNLMMEELNSHKKYYGDKVNLDTEVKIITFKLV